MENRENKILSVRIVLIFVALMVLISAAIYFDSSKNRKLKESEKIEYLVRYSIEDGELNQLLKNNGNYSDLYKYKNFWKAINRVYPKKYLKYVEEFKIIDDGKGKSIVTVRNRKYEENEWSIVVDLADGMDADANPTPIFYEELVKGVFNGISLEVSQIVADEYRNGLDVQKGHFKKDSYQQKFYNKFWKGIASEHGSLVKKNGIDDAKEIFYKNHRDSFANSNAAISSIKDSSETFKIFVYEDKPKGNSILDKKVLFFYEYPELVEIREELRSGLGL